MGGFRSQTPTQTAAVRHNGLDSERRLRFMLESVPVNLWSTDAHLNITFSQGAGLHLIGTSASEQVGMTLYEVLKTRDLVQMHRRYQTECGMLGQCHCRQSSIYFALADIR